MSTWWDNHRDEIAKSDPARAARMDRALQEARDQLARAVPVECGWGNCVNDVDPLTGKVIGGVGAMLCPCDNLPGWNADHPAGMPRPAVPVKVTGRHGSRIQRSRSRHRLPALGDGYEWLPPRR